MSRLITNAASSSETRIRGRRWIVVDMNLVSLPGPGGPCRVGQAVGWRFWTDLRSTLTYFWTDRPTSFRSRTSGRCLCPRLGDPVACVDLRMGLTDMSRPGAARLQPTCAPPEHGR